MVSGAFKAIIIGGGPVGLTAALALKKAGIDFVLLERRPSVVMDAGANLIIMPKSMRILSQLGILDAFINGSTELCKMDRFDHECRNMGELGFDELHKESFGAYPRSISRHNLSKSLWDALSPDSQAKLHCNKKVANIEKSDEGVIVSCEDGTSYAGSIVIGADGAHSITRGHMRRLALEAGSEDVQGEDAFPTTYRLLWLRFPSDMFAELRPGMASEIHGYGAAAQLFVGDDTAVTGLYEPLDEPTSERLRFSDADQAEILRRWGHMPLTRSGEVTLRQAWEGRVDSGLVGLEEGVAKHWSWDGRIVLAGDAAHKFTPLRGEGCNQGIIDVVALANQLNKVVCEARAASPTPVSPSIPDRKSLAAAFEAYQASRLRGAKQARSESSGATAVATWATLSLMLFDYYLLWSQTVQRWLFRPAVVHIANTPVFDYISGEEKFTGKVPWTMPIRQLQAH